MTTDTWGILIALFSAYGAIAVLWGSMRATVKRLVEDRRDDEQAQDKLGKDVSEIKIDVAEMKIMVVELGSRVGRIEQTLSNGIHKRRK